MPEVSVMTVRGPVAADDLGRCLPHEHVVIDMWSNAEWRWDSDRILTDEDEQIDEVRRFKDVGGGTIVDLSLPGIGRDPEALRRISEATDVHIVMGCGWYRQPYYPPDVDRTSTEDLAASLVREIRDGVGPQTIRPGIIGEIGSHKGFVTAQEERAFMAAAWAQCETGLAFTTHSVASKVGLDHLRILTREGVRPDRVVVGHCDSYLRRNYLEAILEQGAYVQFDNIGYPPPDVSALENRLIPMIVELIDRGSVERILLSQDICARPSLSAYGGPGYTYLLTRFEVALKDAGVSAAQWDQMTVKNPAKLLDLPPT
jgi:phosphotriesterase-related protein